MPAPVTTDWVARRDVHGYVRLAAYVALGALHVALVVLAFVIVSLTRAGVL